MTPQPDPAPDPQRQRAINAVGDAVAYLRSAGEDAVATELRSAVSAALAEPDARLAQLEQALRAAAQFMVPDIARGPASNGWANTVSLMESALPGVMRDV